MDSIVLLAKRSGVLQSSGAFRRSWDIRKRRRAAKELTRIEVYPTKSEVSFKALFSCEEFTLALSFSKGRPVMSGRAQEEVATCLELMPDSL
jgi:hypothetical protein